MKKRIASLNELLRLEDGQGFRFRPIKNIEVEIDSVIRIFPSDAKLEKQCSVDISRVKIELPFDQKMFSKIVSQQLGSPKEHQEIWHRQYEEVESGNIVDGTGIVSAFLDGLATGLAWPLKGHVSIR